MMRQRLIAITTVMLAVILGSLPLPGCSGEVSFTTASLSEATMCLGVDSQSKPVNPTTKFPPDTPEIFCSVKLSNAPDDTEVLSEWVYLKGELEGVTDYVIDSLELTTAGTRYLQFSLSIPDAGWPRGDYKLVLYIDGKEKVSLPFTVTDAPGGTPATFPTATPPKATLTNATMALGVDRERKPVNPTTAFAPDTPAIFCSVLLSNAPAAAEVAAEWYYVRGELEGVSNALIDSVSIAVAEGTQYLEFSLSIPDPGWPVGEYRLDLYLDGDLEVTVPFTVAPASSLLSEVTTARSVDSDGRPVNATSTFPANTEEVYVSLLVNEVPAGAMLLVEWYDISDAQTRYLDAIEMEVESNYYYYFWYSFPDGWPRGEYAIVFFLNEVQQTVVTFTVA